MMQSIGIPKHLVGLSSVLGILQVIVQNSISTSDVEVANNKPTPIAPNTILGLKPKTPPTAPNSKVVSVINLPAVPLVHPESFS